MSVMSQAAIDVSDSAMLRTKRSNAKDDGMTTRRGRGIVKKVRPKKVFAVLVVHLPE